MKFYLFCLFIVFSIGCFGQTGKAKYRVDLKDKSGTPFSISKPSDFLSSRAIERRERYNIPIEVSDLPVNSFYVDSIKGAGVNVLHQSKWFNSIITDSIDINTADKLLLFDFVDTITMVWHNGVKTKSQQNENNHHNKLLACVNQQYYNSNFSSSEYGEAFEQINMIAGDRLHNEGYKGKGMMIAVIDAGFWGVDSFPAFASLRDENRIVAERDFVSPGNSVYIEHLHGMLVLSSMAANINGVIIGTAPEAEYLLLRSEDAKSEFLIEEDNWLAAAEFADSIGADVINSSLGYTLFNDSSQNHSYSDMDGNTTRITKAADMAARKGMIVVNSAGNSGYKPWHYIGAPADGDSVLSVGAVDENRVFAPFTSAGPSFDGRIKPEIAAMGVNTVVAHYGNQVNYVNGTSLSSPIIAGMTACLWQANPKYNNMEIIHAIKRMSSQYLSPEERLGYGIPNYYDSHLYLTGKTDTNTFFASVSPVPFNDYLLIDINMLKPNINIALYDVFGKLLFDYEYEDKLQMQSFVKIPDLGSLNSGFYLLKIYNNTFSDSYKLLKVE